jgi:hypothetical protein
MLCILVARYQVVGVGLWLSDKMFVFVLWNLSDQKLGQLVTNIYWLWMFWTCLIMVFGYDIESPWYGSHWYDIFKEVFKYDVL